MLGKGPDRKPTYTAGQSTVEPKFSTDATPRGKTTIGQLISIDGDIRGEEDLVIEGSGKGLIEVPPFLWTP